jgi:hypothetical protein
MTAPFGYRDPDGDVNLEEALGPHLQHYVMIIVSGAAGTIRHDFPLPDEDAPAGSVIRLGWGNPPRASACGEVAVHPSFVWDVCGYYLRLGVHWTATKKELRLAFLLLDPQQQDEHLLYCLTQLLDDVTRRAYDRMELGGIFTWDREVAAALRRRAAREAGRRTKEGQEVTADEVMDEMGFPCQQPQQALPEAPVPSRSRWTAQWGYYLIVGPQGAPRADPVLLEAWQGMIAAALRERGISMAFAVGQGQGDSPVVLRDINEPCIFVFNQKGASPQQAREAIEMGISLGIVETAGNGDI